MKFTIIIISENKPGVLYRVADIFLRRKIEIVSLMLKQIGKTDLTRYVVTVDQTKEVVENLVKQLDKVIEVLRVEAKTDEQLALEEVRLVERVFKTVEEKGGETYGEN